MKDGIVFKERGKKGGGTHLLQTVEYQRKGAYKYPHSNVHTEGTKQTRSKFMVKVINSVENSFWRVKNIT